MSGLYDAAFLSAVDRKIWMVRCQGGPEVAGVSSNILRFVHRWLDVLDT